MEKDKSPVDCRREKQPMSPVRRVYFLRLFGRIAILLICLGLWIGKREVFDVLEGWNGIRSLSVLHILWVIWLMDMLGQLIPVRNYISLGSQKHFPTRFRPIRQTFRKPDLKRYILQANRGAGKVALIWAALTGVIGILRGLGVLDDSMLFLITVVFYVCDLICVLIWCPFRLIMRNRCCTTCRIFNWDHLMMFSPVVFVRGIFTGSLFLLALAVWLVWECAVLFHPERFWEETNTALRCSECTDKLCTQYCRKLRR